MTTYPILLSVVYVLRNRNTELEDIVKSTTNFLGSIVSDYELIIVDNASDDSSLTTLKNLTSPSGFPNLQVYALTKEVDDDIAAWAGVENALGDFVVAIDPSTLSVSPIKRMVEEAVQGADVVFAINKSRKSNSAFYRAVVPIYNSMFKYLNDVNLDKDVSRYRIVNKRVIAFLLRHERPYLGYKYLPATGGFTMQFVDYSSEGSHGVSRTFLSDVDRGMRLLVHSTHLPMRIVTSLTLFGAISNLFYSIYVVASLMLRSDIAPGWVSLSLQQSGMFFLISVALLFIGEYVSHTSNEVSGKPPYHIAQELTSSKLDRELKLNVDVAANIEARI